MRMRTSTMATVESLLTAETFAALPARDVPVELVRGEIVEMNMPSFRHGEVCGAISEIVGGYVRRHKLGRVLTNDSGIITRRSPDSVRGADIAYYSYRSVPKDEHPLIYAARPPEVVFEVKSRDDRWSKIHEKVAEYLAAGVLAVCVVDPETETVAVHHSDRPVESLTAVDELKLPNILGDFHVVVGEFFA
ncbi:MAG TPA: Uma2 family endonuclease [Lacipirellulaceae bacterium]|nr:Uma2 family endonuclease [Lacipirellulaceae bacterium]